MKKKILIVDDEQSIVTLLTYNMENAGYETDVAFDGEEAISKAMANPYDLMILDLMLPEVDGLEVCKTLRQNKVHTPILILTAKEDEFDKILGLELGADDYITKPFSPREIVARVKAILRRVRQPIPEQYTAYEIGELVVYPDKYEATLAGEALAFTRKEFELLAYFAKHTGIVLSRDQLLAQVWDYDFAGDTRIVDVHVSRLRDKIEENSKKPLYLKTVHGLGYKMEEPTS
ncbi:MAG TPA: response regulator transcription factor [Candidatus Avamphibacillus intestinigallinarum]|nr:response regulator transcription factor [Candidatus Avamphibacillus intestinigallinarum]